MILNKFSNRLLFKNAKTLHARAFSFMLLALGFMLLASSFIACNKQANSNANKAYVSLTNVAYGEGPLKIVVEGNYLFGSASVAFGQISGYSGNPYDTVTSKVGNMQLVLASDSMNVVPPGNAIFQQGAHYSVFAYDTLNQNSMGLVILQDNAGIRTDTLTNIRFMNFTPGSLSKNRPFGLKLIYIRDDSFVVTAMNGTDTTIHVATRDTINLALSQFVGYNTSTGVYYFYPVHVGVNQVFAFQDSSNPAGIDSSNFTRFGNVQLDSSTNYNMYLQGFPDTTTGPNIFQLKTVPLN